MAKAPLAAKDPGTPTVGALHGVLHSVLRRLRAGLRRRRETARRQVEHDALLAELAAARAARAPTGNATRLLAIGAWSFPLYSQSFVYQELAALVAAGFDVRMAYTEEGDPEALPPQCAALAGRGLRLPGESAIARRDLAYFRTTRPAAIAELVDVLQRESGRSERELLSDSHILRGFALARIVEAWGAELVHSYFFYEGSLAAFVVQQLLGLPRGLTAYADHQLDDYPWKLAPLQLASADLVVATSQRARRELESLAPGCAPRLIVKPNAIDGEYFAPVVRADPPEGAPFRLLSVARVDPKKGLPDLLAAVAELVRRKIPLVLDLVGGVESGSARGERELAVLKTEIARHRIGRVVAVHGFLPAEGVRAALAAAHLFIAPYVETAAGDKDGVPTALLEAMATGLAVVATHSGAIPELVRDGVDGRLVSAGVPAELAQAIAELLAAPGERARLGAAAAQTVRERFELAVCEPELARRLRILAGVTEPPAD